MCRGTWHMQWEMCPKPEIQKMQGIHNERLNIFLQAAIEQAGKDISYNRATDTYNLCRQWSEVKKVKRMSSSRSKLVILGLLRCMGSMWRPYRTLHRYWISTGKILNIHFNEILRQIATTDIWRKCYTVDKIKHVKQMVLKQYFTTVSK